MYIRNVFLSILALMYYCNKYIKLEKIYCLIRPKNGITPTKRLSEKIQYYFGSLDMSKIEINFKINTNFNFGILTIHLKMKKIS